MSKSKRLGSAGENRIVRKAKEAGLDARKQPGSGVYKDFPADVVVEDLLVESKVRAVQVDPAGERYIRVDLGWFEKVQEEAKAGGFEDGVVIIQPKGARKQIAMVEVPLLLALLCIKKVHASPGSSP